jgi:hypothetical protein
MFLTLCAATNLALAQVPDSKPPRLTNGPPAVRLISPQDGAVFLVGQKIHICAVSLNFTDAVTQVEFFAGTNSLGVVTNSPTLWGARRGGPPSGAYACITWSNAPAGAYSITAEATDLAGLTVVSEPADISVMTNLPPRVQIVRPKDNAIIRGPGNILISATAFDPDGSVVSVEFFQGSTSIGVVTNVPPTWVRNSLDVFPLRQTAYNLVWSNVPPAAYSLTAVATDNQGTTSVSATVDITVVTNLAPVVKLIAPAPGCRFFAPATIPLRAAATDPDGTVVGVEFFSGTDSLGVVTNGVTETNWPCAVRTVFSLILSNVPVGSYSFTATATDDDGAASTSPPVLATVVAPPAPSVRITHPANGARYVAPATVYIATQARNFPNPVATVQFLAGTTTLGVISNSSWPTFRWSPVPPGTYTLRVIATDTAANAATSAPVNITVVTNRMPPPPPTRRPIGF